MHPGHIDGFIILLLDLVDQIVYFQFTLFPCRTAWHDHHNLGIIAFACQTCTDPFEAVGHVDVEIFLLLGIEIIGMRIKYICDAVYVHLKTIGPPEFLKALKPVIYELLYILPGFFL